MAFNINYIYDLKKVFDKSDKITFSINSTMTPVVAENEAGIKVVLMPIRR